MKIQLTDGTFDSDDAMNIALKMIEIKINYHENMIRSADLEEDIEFRERKIRTLCESMDYLRKNLHNKRSKVVMKSVIIIDGQEGQ